VTEARQVVLVRVARAVSVDNVGDDSRSRHEFSAQTEHEAVAAAKAWAATELEATETPWIIERYHFETKTWHYVEHAR
jgi:hypothetical protein